MNETQNRAVLDAWMARRSLEATRDGVRAAMAARAYMAARQGRTLARWAEHRSRIEGE